MLFMVVERSGNRRPDGLRCVDRRVEAAFDRCFGLVVTSTGAATVVNAHGDPEMAAEAGL